MSHQTSANQLPPLEPYNLFTTDPVLAEAVERESDSSGWRSWIAIRRARSSCVCRGGAGTVHWTSRWAPGARVCTGAV